jgi:hypothetical protein
VARSHPFNTLTHRFMKAILKPACLGGLLCGLVLAIAPKTQAQEVNYYGIDYVGANVDALIGTQRVLNGMRQNDGSTTPPKIRKATQSSSGRSNLAYSPTPALKQKVVQSYVSRMNNTTSATSQAIAADFASGKNDYSKIYQSLVKGKGLRENDVADVMSGYMILAYTIVNDVDGNAITAPMARGVRSQIAPMLSSNSGLTVPGVAAQMGEDMKLKMAVLQSSRQAAIEQNSLPNYREAIAILFKNQYGMDMTQLRLTDRGFAKK